MKFVQDGKLGKIKFVKGMCYKARQSIGQGGNGTIPEGVNYDLWCGPAELESPLRRKKFHYDWHWFYAYGNGDMGNQGIHQMDVARWYLGENTIAPRTMSIGGRLGYDDDGETPNTQVVYHDYDSAPLIFETRGLPKSKEAQKDWGKNMESPDEFEGMSGVSVVVACEGGFVFTDAGGKVKIKDLDGKEMPAPEAFKTEDIFENFISAVKSRKVEEQYAADHLGRNGVDLAKESIVLGPMLKFNPATEWAEGNGELDTPANQLATREYRAPYTVPEVL